MRYRYNNVWPNERSNGITGQPKNNVFADNVGWWKHKNRVNLGLRVWDTDSWPDNPETRLQSLYIWNVITQPGATAKQTQLG